MAVDTAQKRESLLELLHIGGGIDASDRLTLLDLYGGIAGGAPPTTYSVTYNGNGNDGGSAPVDSNSPYEEGAIVTVLGNSGALAKTGYMFITWNTEADGSGTTRAPGTLFAIGADAVTLYAQWDLTPVPGPSSEGSGESTGRVYNMRKPSQRRVRVYRGGR